MTAAPIIPNLDELEYLLASLLERGEPTAMHHLLLQRSEKTLDNGVVIAVAPTTHAAHDLGSTQRFLKSTTGILASAVAVVQQTGARTTLTKRHLESVQDQSLVQTRLHRPTDHPAGKQVHNDGKIQPAFARPQVRNICISAAQRSSALEAPKPWFSRFSATGSGCFESVVTT